VRRAEIVGAAAAEWQRAAMQVLKAGENAAKNFLKHMSEVFAGRCGPG
jgi:hypothetical protein